MADRMMLNVEVDRELFDHVAASVGSEGLYDSVGDYVRDLIRQDQEQSTAHFITVKEHLQKAFAVPESEYKYVTLEEIIARGRARRRA